MGLEDGVVFVNNFIAQLQENLSLPLDAAMVERVFVETQGACAPRTRKLMGESFLTQSMHAWKNPLFKFMVLHILPILGFDFVLAQLVGGVRPAPLLNMLPKPRRGGIVGFDDDHSGHPSILRVLMKFVTYISLILCGIWALIYADAPARSDPRFSYADGIFRLDMSGILLIMLIEGWRRTNKLSILQWPVIWALLTDLFGFQVISPFFYLFNYGVNSQRGRLQWVTTNRPVVLPAAKAIFPVVTLFYMLPVASRSLMGQLDTTADFIRNSGLSSWPAATSAALVTLAFSLTRSREDSFFGRKYLGHIRIGYKCIFALLSLLHLSSLAWQAKNKSLFWPFPARLAELVWLLATYSEVSRYHRIRQHSLLNVALIVIGFLVVGPGATATAVWYWREELDEESQAKAQAPGIA